jgi:hypothetical protein
MTEIRYDTRGRRIPDMSKAVSRGGKKINWRAPEDMDKCTVCMGLLDSKHKYWCKACRKAWRDQHYAKHPEKLEPGRKAAARWNKANPERHKENAKRHRKTEKARETQKRWRERNPDIIKNADANKRHKRRAAIAGEVVSNEDWQWLIRQYNENCAYCGQYMEKPTRDHYVPLAKGGRNVASNIVPSCNSCNCSKQAKTGEQLEEWIVARGASESMVMREVIVAASERGHRLFRNNVGVAKYGKTTVPYGLGVGSPDLVGWTSKGEFVAIEVKAPGKKPKPHQDQWMEAAKQSCPVLRIGWADSVERAMEILEGEPGLPPG